MPTSEQSASRISAVSVVIPALNEREPIGFVVASVLQQGVSECIVVDNGSTDDTAEIARIAGARVITSPRGYGAACKTGSCAALVSSTILVFMDGDGSDVVSDLQCLVEPILAGDADFVIGSRIRGKREPGSMLPSQVFAGRLVSFLLRLMYGVSYTDMGPFRAIRRDALDALGMTEMTYGWNLEMQVKVAQQKLRILEIPVDYRCRTGGTSKVSGNFSANLRTGVRILAVLVRTSFASPYKLYRRGPEGI